MQERNKGMKSKQNKQNHPRTTATNYIPSHQHPEGSTPHPQAPQGDFAEPHGCPF